MPSRRKKKSRLFHATPATALLLLVGGYALFSVLFRYELPAVNAREHKTGRIALYPVRPSSAEARWLEVHDPARIARGGDFPEPETRPEPGNVPAPEPVVKAELPTAVSPEPINRERIPVSLPPVAQKQNGELVFQKLTPESYPKVTVNGAKYDGNLTESLLKQAASVNAGTVELRFTRGVMEKERRVLVNRSSGNVRLDLALAKYFSSKDFPELPAVIRIVWDAAGEVKK